MTSSDSNAERVYAIRFSTGADQEITAAFVRLADISGSEEIALEWLQGIRAAVVTLATNPQRFQAQAQESRVLGGEVRRLLYRRTNVTSAAHHIYYRVYEDSDDGPLIRILHLRHAARKPMTRKKAREIQDAK